MSRAPLDYYTIAPAHDAPPRLSKLAIGSLTVSLISGLALCGPVLPFIRRNVPPELQSLVLVSIPIFTLALSVLALLRILNALDELKGEGIAIAGMVTSIVTGLIVLMIVVLPCCVLRSLDDHSTITRPARARGPCSCRKA